MPTAVKSFLSIFLSRPFRVERLCVRLSSVLKSNALKCRPEVNVHGGIVDAAAAARMTTAASLVRTVCWLVRRMWTRKTMTFLNFVSPRSFNPLISNESKIRSTNRRSPCFGCRVQEEESGVSQIGAWPTSHAGTVLYRTVLLPRRSL